MATANPNLGAVRGYAGGGFISKLFGPSETVTEKFARQDAEFRAKHPERTQAAPQQQAPTVIGGIKGMISGSLKTNLQEREKAAGLKAGGMVKKCVTGGKITGPGGPTDDLVPIMASNGEFMIKASSAKVLGPKVLKALNDVGGKGAPSEPGKMAGGGMVRKMATGGLVDDELNKRVAQIPAGGTAPAPDGQSNGNDFTRNVNNSLNALGGMGVVASVPLKAAGAASEGLGAIRTAMNAEPVLQNSIPRLAAPIAKAAQAAPDFVAGASGVQRVGGANLPAVVQNAGIPIAKTTNAALQEGAQANQMAAGTRSLGNASAGAGMLDQQQAPLEQVPPVAPSAPSLNAPWYSPEYAKAANASDLNGLELERARRAAGSQGDANDPLKNILLNGAVGESSASPTAATSPANAYNDPSRRLDVNYGAPAPTAPAPTAPAAAPVDEFSNAAIAQRNPGGMVRKVVGADGRTTYSGSNISGDVSFQGADGNALPGRPGGGSMTYGGMSQEAIKSALTNPDGSSWSAGDNAIMAANIRDGVDPYRGTSRGQPGGVTGFNGAGSQWERDKNAWNASVSASSITDNSGLSARQRRTLAQGDQNIALKGRELDNTMTTSQMRNATDIRGQDIQDKRNSEANQIAQGNLGINQQQLGMSRTELVSKMAKEKQIADVQAEYMAAQGDPVKEAAAKRKMLALGLIKESENKFTVVPDFDANGQRIGTTVLDQAGKPLDFKGGQQATPRAEYDKLPKGSTYTGTDGKQYTKG